ncbi:MAG TPA: hypothetical protein QF423_05810 [Candidatus Scalindua sp.]|jgi:hypothetical protein|nr:hypothetical protein [Candidatus Scalindua sp.]
MTSGVKKVDRFVKNRCLKYAKEVSIKLIFCFICAVALIATHAKNIWE